MDKIEKPNNLLDSLEDAYDEALKDEEFKNFVGKIKLKRSTLIKYTSSLEESFLEYSHCKE